MLKRVVTSIADGRSVIASDEMPSRHSFPSVPGFSVTDYWSTPPIPRHPGALERDAAGIRLPRAGATRLLVVTFPPDNVFSSPGFDPARAAEEQLAHMPDLASRFEADDPAMHCTPTVDYGLVIDGSIVLEVDDGAAVTLGRGDIVIQNGGRHAWRNPGDRPATMLFVMIGDASAPHG